MPKRLPGTTAAVCESGARIAFVNPPFKPRFSRESRSPAVAKGGTLYYPHWLAYAAAFARHRGQAIDLIDGCATSTSATDIVNRLKSFSAELVVVNTSTPSIYNDLHFADTVKRALPEACVVAVGAHVSATPVESFAYVRSEGLQLDGAVLGEYDASITAIAECIRRRESILQCPGLAYATADNGVIKNPKPEPISDLDGWPLVSEIYREFLHIPAYYYSHSKHPLVTIITGRGCPYRCTYCQLPQVMHGHVYRRRSVSDIVREFRFLHDEMPYIRSIMIEDDTFTVDRARVRELCAHLVEEGLTKIPWTCNARADVDFETLQAMKRAGARMMCVGFESGDTSILNGVRKGTKLSRVEEFANDARRAGLMVHGCFMFGNAMETRETMARTLEFALRLPIDTAQFFPLMVSPGTVDYERFKAGGLLKIISFAEWNDSKGNHQATVERPDLPSKCIEAFCDYARRQFYLRPRYIGYKLKQSLFDREELVRNAKSFRVLAGHLMQSGRLPA